MARIVTAASLDFPYKGIDLLAEAVARTEGLEAVELDIIGDGKLRGRYVELMRDLGLDKRVIFHGRLGHTRMREVYSNCDLFVLASQSEGLPRVLIEAMAYGMPCLATDVGGIRELLEPTSLIPIRQWRSIGEAILSMSSRSEREGVGNRNMKRAQAYRQEILNTRRISFLKRSLNPYHHGGIDSRAI